MANTAAWNGGAGAGLTYASVFNSTDLASMGNSGVVLSSIADITNGTALDLYMDISYLLAIASNTIAAGANIAFWIYNLNQDASHYGDGQFTASAQSTTLTPSFPPAATIGIPAVASTTNMYGTATGITIPPGTFRLVVQNNSGFALTSGTQTIKYRTYKLNLNA